MELDRLNEFVIIAQQKSIKKASELLSVSPATLGARLSSFEDSLGISLFDRQRDGLSLTESGNRLYSNALAIVSRYQSLKTELQFLNQEEYHTLRIAIVGSGMPFYLGPYLDLISKKNPEIHLDLMDDSTYSIQEGLLSEKIDLYFAPAMGHIPLEGIVRQSLTVAHQYVIMPLFHPLARNSSVTLKELEGETFILYPETGESCIRDFQLENLKAAGIRFSTYESDTSTLFYQLLVPIGKGLLLTPIHAMGEVPNCTTLPVSDITYPAPNTMFYKRGCTKPEIQNFVTGFTRFIKENSTNEHRKAL